MHIIAYVLIGILVAFLSVFGVAWIVRRRKTHFGYDLKVRNDVEQAVWIDKSEATGFRENQPESQELHASEPEPLVEEQPEAETLEDEDDKPNSPRKPNGVRYVNSCPL